MDWPAVFALAGQQKLLPILFEAVRKMPAAAENAALFAAVKQQAIAQVLNQTVRSAEFADLYHKLRAAGLHPIVVKGQLCSRLYPLRDHRISADDDLYIPDAEFMACHEQLLANGLTTDTPADELPTADEVPYTKDGSPLYIELHRHLFDSAEDAHDELNHLPNIKQQELHSIKKTFWAKKKTGGRDCSLPPAAYRSMPTAFCFFACCTAFSALRRRLKSSRSRVFS